jgi:hypothetical protein
LHRLFIPLPEDDLRYEIKIESTKVKDLTVRLGQNPPGAARFKSGTVVADPKHSEVIRFYEDLTNLLITNVKPQLSNSEESEWVLSCIFTYVDAEDPSTDIRKSKLTRWKFHDVNTHVYLLPGLNFTLRTCDEPADESDEHVKSVHYIPLELDKEPMDYVENLSFLGSPFTFPRDQLPLFLRTVYTNMGDATKGKVDEVEDSDNNDSVQFVE